MAEVLRCAIYIRVSTAMQKMEGWSLEAQEAALTAFAARKGWKVAGVYADEGKTARKRLKDRREIFRLLDDVRAGLVDVVLFKELDRWFRNVSDFYKVQEVLDAAGVYWVSEQQPGLEMRTKEGRLSVNVMLSVGQNEADACSERIKYTNKYMRSRKRWTSGSYTLPRGYTLDGDQHVIIDPEQEPVIRDLIASTLRLGSFRAAFLDVTSRHSLSWTYANAYRVMRNPMLCGSYKGIDDFVAEPYLTEPEWLELQNCMRRNATLTPSREVYIFASLVVCGCCGRRMVGGHKTKHNSYHLYKCMRARTEHDCENRSVAIETKLEAALLDMVADAVADKIVEVRAVSESKKIKPRSNRALIDRKLDRLEDLYINSDRMSRERYEAKRAEILAQLVEPEEPEAPGPSLASLEKIQALFDSGVRELYAGMTLLERRRFWRGILDHFVVRNGQIVDIIFLSD